MNALQIDDPALFCYVVYFCVFLDLYRAGLNLVLSVLNTNDPWNPSQLNAISCAVKLAIFAGHNITLLVVFLVFVFIVVALYKMHRATELNAQAAAAALARAAVEIKRECWREFDLAQDFKEDDDDTPDVAKRAGTVIKFETDSCNMGDSCNLGGCEQDSSTTAEDEKTVEYSTDGFRSPIGKGNALEDGDFQEVMRRSVSDPRVLVGWQVALQNGQIGMIVGTVKRKFSTTRFHVEMADGSVVNLPLQRGRKKGSVPFTLLEKLN
jgi:hypothetical protein